MQRNAFVALNIDAILYERLHRKFNQRNEYIIIEIRMYSEQELAAKKNLASARAFVCACVFMDKASINLSLAIYLSDHLWNYGFWCTFNILSI